MDRRRPSGMDWIKEEKGRINRERRVEWICLRGEGRMDWVQKIRSE